MRVHASTGSRGEARISRAVPSPGKFSRNGLVAACPLHSLPPAPSAPLRRAHSSHTHLHEVRGELVFRRQQLIESGNTHIRTSAQACHPCSHRAVG